MKPEQTMRKRVVSVLRPLGAFSVENGVGAPGVPDVCFVGGWLELKCAPEGWPVRGGVLRLPHEFGAAQRVWHLKWARAGGRSWVLLRVGDDWILVPGDVAALHLEKDWTRADLEILGLISSRCHFWTASLDEKGLLECLSRS